MTYYYSVFGLIIQSCLELPELLPGEGKPDIFIRWGQVPDVLEDSRKVTPYFQAKPGTLLLNVAPVARILVSNGNEILVELLPNAAETTVRSFIIGSAFGAILHQRKLLPLHASGIKTPHGCVMFCGKPGSGKSTIANIFMQRGYPLHADDICVVGPNPDGLPRVYPSYPHMKLWGDTLQKLGHEPATYNPVLWFPDKFVVPVAHFNRDSLPIHKIFILTPHDSDQLELFPVTGINKYKVLKRQTYRRKLLEGMATPQFHFLAAMQLGQHIPMIRVFRPKNQFLSNELADLLEKNF